MKYEVRVLLHSHSPFLVCGIRLVWVCAFIAFLGNFTLKATDQEPPVAQTGLTADAAFGEAHRLFTEKKYEEAAAVYSKFREDYGRSSEAQTAVHNSLYPLAYCYVALKKYASAVPAITEAIAANPPLPPERILELQFWLGVANFQIKEGAAAREALEKFLTMADEGRAKNPLFKKQNPISAHTQEARLLAASTWLIEGKNREAADHFSKIMLLLEKEDRGRAVIYELYALQECADDEAALQVVNAEYPHMDSIPQIISFQMLIFKLGDRFLERGEFRKAIQCLQKVWPRERLLKHQEERLELWEQKLKVAELNSLADPSAKTFAARLIEDARRETDGFKKAPDFDTALQFRLAMAYLRMERFREAALIMENMASELPINDLNESASLNVIRCWNALESWPKSITAAENFAKLFPNSKCLPQVLYMEGEACRSALQYDKAVEIFDHLATKFTNDDFGSRARFLKAFALLQAEKNTESAAAFSEFVIAFPTHELVDDADYWLGMSWAFDKQYDKALKAMEAYLGKHKSGIHRGAAVYRMAYCHQQMGKFGTAIDELHDYLEKFPAEPENGEARILLGNALMNEGFIDDAFDVFRAIPESDKKLHEESVFRTADGLKALEEKEKFRDLMQEYISKNPKSPRVAEAISNLGWYYRQSDQIDKARDIYWQAITEHGNDPDIRSVEDLFPSLARLYRSPEETLQYQARLGDMVSESQASKKHTLLMRILHAQSKSVLKTDPAQSLALLLEAGKYIDVTKTNPVLLVDFANALLESGQDKSGEDLLRDTLRWNPRAIQKDRILSSLGDIEFRHGKEKAALDYYTRFEKETLGSAIFGETMLKYARLLKKRGKNAESLRVLDAVLAFPSTKGKEKAEALVTIGDIHLANGKPEMAIPYYQRVYVMHGQWKPWVAKAYLRSGEAFEKIKDSKSARKTYQELVSNPDLAEFPETATASEHLLSLGGPLPPNEPSEKSPQG